MSSLFLAGFALLQGSATLAQAGPPAALPAPTGRQDFFLDGLGISLDVNNDTSEATLEYGRKFKPVTSADGERASFAQTGVTASLALPLGGKDDLTDPNVLDRLSNGTKLSVGLSHFTFSRSDGEGGPSKPGAWQFSADASVGLSGFDFRTPGTLTEGSADKVQFGVGGDITYYPSDYSSSIRAGVEFQRAYEAQDDQILCKSPLTDPKADCVKAAPGGPTRDDSLVFRLEYRRTVSIGWDAAFLAFSPTFSMDALSDEYAAELPIYLVPEGKWPVLPGIKVGYSSKKDKVTLGLFLKQSFKF